jgi:hypothetical protein
MLRKTLVADGDDFGILWFLLWSFEVGSLLHELHSNEINSLRWKGWLVCQFENDYRISSK